MPGSDETPERAVSDTATLRVFFALVPPAELRDALAELGRERARRLHGRPVPADNIHLTLAFVGAWPRARLDALLAAGAALEGEAMRVMLDRQGGFRRSGVAWVAPSSAPATLGMLAHSLAANLRANRVPYDERPFHPHLTIARKCHGPFVRGDVGPYPWGIERVALVASDTRAEGARYTMLATWPLARGDEAWPDLD
ncbi:MAG: RNA 2',3'-cyclic phosphodiesterase [Rudaea sp.]